MWLYAGAVSHPYEHAYFSHIAMHSLAYRRRYCRMERQSVCQEICEWAHRTVNATHRHSIYLVSVFLYGNTLTLAIPTK